MIPRVEEESIREILDFCHDNHFKTKESRQQDTVTLPTRDFRIGDREALKTLSRTKFRKPISILVSRDQNVW